MRELIKQGILIKIWIESSHTLTVGCIFWCAYRENEEHWSWCPANTRICDGSELSRTEYAELFSLIGTQHGAGDGSTTFNIPNLNSRFIEGGWSSPNFPNTIGKHIEAGLPNITGTLGQRGNRSGLATGSGAFYISSNLTGLSAMDNVNVKNPVYIYFDASRSSAIYGKSNTVQPNAMFLIPCIVVKSNTLVTYCFRRTV